jgi:DNA repair protein RecO (recombination protein O)
LSAPQRSYKTLAVVLRGRTYGEADRILTLFSTERGKMDAIAKGSRRTKSHLAGRLEFGNEVLLGMHRGRNLDVVVSADIERSNWQQLVQPERFAAANMIAELIDAFCEPDLAQPEIYALLTAALRAIGRSDGPLSLLPRFSMRLLDALGLAPPVETCVQCSKTLDSQAWLDSDQGGFVCDACRVRWPQGVALDSRDVHNLQAIAAPPGGTRTPALRATRNVALAVEALVNHHLGRKPKAGVHALEFVRQG